MAASRHERPSISIVCEETSCQVTNDPQSPMQQVLAGERNRLISNIRSACPASAGFTEIFFDLPAHDAL